MEDVWTLYIPIILCLGTIGYSQHFITKRYYGNTGQLSYGLKHVGQRLFPFFIKTIVFLSHIVEVVANPITFAVLKCLPTLSLILFLLEEDNILATKNRYRRRIIIGLFFSVLGDVFLVGESRLHFKIGLLMFAFAHLSYIFAFGWSQFRPYIVGIFSVMGISVFLFLLQSKDLDRYNIITYCVAVYICLIGTMAVAATSRITSTMESSIICGFVGAIFFMISDITLAVNEFFGTIRFGHLIVMVTYYTAQLGISLSAVSINF